MNDKNDKNFMSGSGGRISTTSVVLFYSFLIVIDQFTKYFAFKSLSTKVLSAGIGIEQFRNYYFAFSLPVPAAVAYGIYVVILIGAVLHVSKKYKTFTRPEALAWTLIFAGAVSNVGERIYLGYVRDFIYILSGIFNVADGYIIAGMLMLIWKSRQNPNSSATKIFQ